VTGRPFAGDVQRAVADAHRREWAFVLASTTRTTRDLDLAEEAVQDAYVSALTAWARDGVPSAPGAWLTTAARRNALNALKRGQVLRTKLPLLLEREPAEEDDPMETGGPDTIPDDRLRLVFTCCHPALAGEAQVALTLRLVCGVATGDIAQAFLVSEPTMAARLTRAKKKIAAARIPYVVPAAADLPDRLDAVLGVIHLLYTLGHTAPSGEDLVRADLAERAIDLARMLRDLLPEPEVLGLLALLVVNHARRATRTDAQGRLLRLADQDRTAWDREAIAEGDQSKIHDEIGDLLFTIANIARKLDVNAEEALQSSNRKFTRRFRAMESKVHAAGRNLDQLTLEEMDALWDEAKAAEHS